MITEFKIFEKYDDYKIGDIIINIMNVLYLVVAVNGRNITIMVLGKYSYEKIEWYFNQDIQIAKPMTIRHLYDYEKDKVFESLKSNLTDDINNSFKLKTSIDLNDKVEKYFINKKAKEFNL